MLKNQIRKKILRFRKIKNSQNKQPKINEIFKILKKLKIKKKIIGCYLPVNYEMDTKELMKKLITRGYIISLPVIEKNSKMNFYLWEFDHPLYLNKFGIPEPKKDKKVVPNILIIPLVAFDKHLNRLGYGGGYYDRLLKKMENNKLLKIGLAFSYQKVKKLPVGIYDKKLDYVITEKGLFK